MSRQDEQVGWKTVNTEQVEIMREARMNSHTPDESTRAQHRAVDGRKKEETEMSRK